MTTGPLTELLARKPVLVLDGAMGTELQRRGVDTGLPLWSARALMTHPEAVLQIHQEYVQAGADILTANTFRTTVRTFRKAEASRGLGEGRSTGLKSPSEISGDLTMLAVALARKAADEATGRTVLVAGSIAPLEDCYRPDLVPPESELRDEHELQAVRLARAGVDFIILETMGTIREAVAALAAARETGNEVVVSFICKEDGRLFGGEPIEDAVRAVAGLKPTLVSLNCVPVKQTHAAIDALKGAWKGPWAIYANAGRPEELDSGVITTAVPPSDYGQHARRWLAAGASVVGGCCGTTPAHIREIRKAVPL